MPKVLESGGLDSLFGALREAGYTVVGPTVRDGAILYAELESPAELPRGWTDEQEAGTYRLKRRSDEARFGYAVGPHSWKKFLYPPALRLWEATRTDEGLQIAEEPRRSPRYAFLGVRACELHAIGIQDRVFVDGPHVDPVYEKRRRSSLIVAVNCTAPASTCFCVSMGTGPAVEGDFDLALTEVLDGPGAPYLTVEAGSSAGAAILESLPHRDSTGEESEAAGRAVDRAAAAMGRTLDTTDIHQVLQEAYEHPRWDEVAERCLTCGNCTLVCPTCFCFTVEDVTDLTGGRAERWRRWDSCFTTDFSYIHGSSVRGSSRSRYRQWLTHKLGTWIDQFGTSGCVGCGRCITWCPVGIDITEEMAALRRDGDAEVEGGTRRTGAQASPETEKER